MTNNKISIRFANEKDYKELCSFYKRKIGRSSLKNMLKQEYIKIAVAAINNRVIGKVLLYMLPWAAGKKKNKRAILAELYVKREYRGQGIANKLIEFCVKHAKKYAEDIQGDRVEPENKISIKICRKIFPKEKLTFSYP